MSIKDRTNPSYGMKQRMNAAVLQALPELSDGEIDRIAKHPDRLAWLMWRTFVRPTQRGFGCPPTLELDFEEAYGVLGLGTHYADCPPGLKIQRPGLWNIPMVKGLSWAGLRSAFANFSIPVRDNEWPRSLTNMATFRSSEWKDERSPDHGSYAVLFRQSDSWDTPLMEAGIDDVKEIKDPTITALEYMFLDFCYFLANGQYLKCPSLCACTGTRGKGYEDSVQTLRIGGSDTAGDYYSYNIYESYLQDKTGTRKVVE